MILGVTCHVSSNPTCSIGKHLNNRERSPPWTVISNLNRFSDHKTPKSTVLSCEPRKLCEYYDLHKELVPYQEAWSWQKSIVKEKKALIEKNTDCPDTLIVLQHQPVYTMGTASSEEFLNFDLKNAPYDVYRTERGGEVTYHGPGQLVMYPVINLRNHKMDLHWYLRALEEMVIRVLSETFSIKASRLEGFTGVWVGNQKLAAIGIRVTKWITYHGLALNVSTELTPFKWIVPCGIRERKVGSIKELLGECQSTGCGKINKHYRSDSQLIDIAHKSLIKEFSEVFQLGLYHKVSSVCPCRERKTSKFSFSERNLVEKIEHRMVDYTLDE